MVAWLPVVFSSALAFSDPAVTPKAASTPTVSERLFLAPERRVRAADPQIKSLLVEGLQRSATFASLLLEINRTDVIVYIERVMSLPKETLGRLTMVPIPSTARYLRIQIRAELTRNDAIALIGHELQHALEVARDATVHDADGMIALYRRIGHSSGGEHVYDTTAAQDTGRQVRRELTMAAGPEFRGTVSDVSMKEMRRRTN